METPSWYTELELIVGFPRLVEFELWLTLYCAHYFRNVPYSLSETVWTTGLMSACDAPLCCWDIGVLYYPMLPQPKLLTQLSRPVHDEPVVLEVSLNTPDAPPT